MKTALRIIGGAALALASLFVGLKSQTQPVMNPTQYTFTAPSDYDATFADGSKVVVSIETDYLDAGVVAAAIPSGHPAKDANGQVTVGIAGKPSSLANNKNYLIAYRTINPFDSTTSDPSAVAVFWANTKPVKGGSPRPCNRTDSLPCP